MNINEVKLSIKCQLRNQTNYVKNNAIRICNNALKIDSICREKILYVKSIKKAIEDIEDPWQWNGIPSRKETEQILVWLRILEIVLNKKVR